MATWSSSLLAAALLVVPALAQQTFDLPTLRFNPQNNSFPFGGAPMRYQQWFAASEWQQQAQKPIRVIGMRFYAGPGGQGPTGRVVDIEVRIAHALPTTFSGTFDNNFVSDETLVFPRGPLTLQAPGSSALPVQINFQSEFVWDGQSGVVIDIRMFDNGNGGVPYTYDLEYSGFTQHRSARLYTSGDPLARQATQVHPGTGLRTQFVFHEALGFPYGQGCAGDGMFVPEHGVQGGHPIPGNAAYTMTLENAPSQRTALFFIGFSATQWGGNPLPFELTLLGARGCFILAEPAAGVTTTTVGGGAGTGLAQFPLPMPPTTSWVGNDFFTQWLVLDPNSPNGLLCVSNGVRHITALQ